MGHIGVIIAVIIIIAVIATLVSRSMGPFSPYGQAPPANNLAEAVENAQATASILATALATLDTQAEAAAAIGAMLSSAAPSPPLNTSQLAAALTTYGAAFQGASGTAQIVGDYVAGVQGLSAATPTVQIVLAADGEALPSAILLLAAGVQGIATAVSALVQEIAAAGGQSMSAAVSASLSQAANYTQTLLTDYATLISAGNVAAAAAAVVVQYATGSPPITDAFRTREKFGASCHSQAPSKSCGPPFSVCATNRYRVDAGGDAAPAILYKPYENPIINPWGGLAIWP